MISAILLAAGLSRRFGAPKLLQDLEGRAVVRWSAEALLRRPVDEVIVVVPPDHDELRRALSGLEVRFVVNPRPEDGMGTSVACGIRALGPEVEAALIVLADEPRTPAGALERVVSRFRVGGAAIVVPTFRGTRGHPVIFDRSVFAELQELSGDHGARAVTDADPARVAKVEIDEDKPADVDTPSDLARLRR